MGGAGKGGVLKIEGFSSVCQSGREGPERLARGDVIDGATSRTASWRSTEGASRFKSSLSLYSA